MKSHCSVVRRTTWFQCFSSTWYRIIKYHTNNMPYNTIILQSVIFSSFCRNEKGLKETREKNCCMKTSSNISSLSIVSKTEIFSKVEWKIARDIPRNSSYDLKNLTRTSSKQPRVKNISRGEIYIYIRLPGGWLLLLIEWPRPVCHGYKGCSGVRWIVIMHLTDGPSPSPPSLGQMDSGIEESRR